MTTLGRLLALWDDDDCGEEVSQLLTSHFDEIYFKDFYGVAREGVYVANAMFDKGVEIGSPESDVYEEVAHRSYQCAVNDFAKLLKVSPSGLYLMMLDIMGNNRLLRSIPFKHIPVYVEFFEYGHPLGIQGEINRAFSESLKRTKPERNLVDFNAWLIPWKAHASS